VLARLSKSSEACRGTQVTIGGWVYIYSCFYIFVDFECQPVCRPTSKTFKGGRRLCRCICTRWAT